MKKSRLPCTPIARLEAKSESPTATTRVSGVLGCSGESGLAFAGFGGVTVAGADTAAARVIGPCLSPLSALNSTSPLPADNDEMSTSAQLCWLVATSGCARWPFEPPSIGDIDRAIGYAVSTRKPWVIGWDGYCAATGTDASVPSICPTPLASSTTSLPALMPHSARNCVNNGCAAPAFAGGSSSTSSLPPLATYVFSASISGGKKSVVGPAITTTVASSGTAFCVISTSESTPKLSCFNASRMVL